MQHAGIEAELRKEMERGGEELNEMRQPGGDPPDARGDLGEVPGHAPRQDALPRRAGERIAVPWGISRIRLLGALEIDVIDEPSSARREARPAASSSQMHRELEIASIKGFGPMAKAAFVALVLSLKSGRTSAQLGEAMEGSPNPPLALPTHLSAVRRTGLLISHRAGIYRVEGIERSQVDALQFEDIYKKLKLINAGHGNENNADIIAWAEAALELWQGDPLAAHPYFADRLALKHFADWHADIQRWYVKALLSRGENVDLANAARLVEQLEERDPRHPDIQQLRDAVHASSSSAWDSEPAFSTPQIPWNRNASVRRPAPSWLPRYEECLRELTTSLDLRGFGAEILSSSSLSAVYTPLYAQPRSQEQPELTEASRPLLETVVRHTRATVIVGESGSGKSTFLSYLCTKHFAEESGAIPLFIELIALNDISDDRLDSHGRLPWHVIPALFRSRFADLGVEVSVEELDDLAKQTPVMWLLDGLNEISSPEVRWSLADAVSMCARRWPKAWFVITTTETALPSHGVPPGFQRVDIDDFRSDDVDSFLNAFSKDFYSDLTEPQRREKWEPLATAVRNSADLKDMAKSPLRMTAMALAYLHEGRLPDNRADLLRGAVSWLIRKKSPILRPYVRSGQDLRTVFAELAYQMMAAEERPLSKVGIAWAANRLGSLDCFTRNARDFLDTAVSAGGLLIQRSFGDLGMHDAFRDYLAASRIAAKTDDEASGWWSELQARLDDTEWHSVLALVPGSLLLLGGSERVDLFFDRLGAECTDQPLGVRAARVALGGRILRELGLSGYRLTRAPKWAAAVKSVRQLFDDPREVPLHVRIGAAVAYGIMGDDRLADWDATWTSISEGSFWMGAQSVDPNSPNYDPDAAPWESPVVHIHVPLFAIRKFLITVSEYNDFIEDGGYRTAKYWTAEGWQWRIRSHAEAPIEWQDQLSVPNAPVTGVNWFECMAYCKWLTERSDGNAVYRLPYENEWEYAAKRDIQSTQFRWGNRMQAEDNAEANWAGCFLRHKTPVGLFPMSTTGDNVADLFGNVEEWCMDEWASDDYPYTNENSMPLSVSRTVIERSAGGWSSQGTKRIVRGGSCIRFSRLCRPSYRSRILQERRYLTVGLRPVRMIRSSDD